MGRKRPEKDKWMPAKLYKGKSAYEYRPIPGVCIRVCDLEQTKPIVLKRFTQEYERFMTSSGTVKALVAEFFESPQFTCLAVQTRSDYEKYWRQMEPVFGATDAKAIKPEHIRKYLDLKGKTSQTQANRHLSFLSRVFGWGYERGKVLINPCKGVRRYKEVARTRYITDEEYQLIYDLASTPIKALMEISYLCAARESDVLKLKKNQLTEAGIYIKQNKTGKEQVKEWTPRLRAAIALAATIETKISSMYVIPTTAGTSYTPDGFRANWHRLMVKAREQSGQELDFTFHDIKAKSISDYEGDKRAFSGHKTASQVEVYDRKLKSVPSLGGEK